MVILSRAPPCPTTTPSILNSILNLGSASKEAVVGAMVVQWDARTAKGWGHLVNRNTVQ